MSEFAVVGIDLGKNVFHVVAMDVQGHIIKHRKYTRPQLFALFRSLPPCLVGMEACASAHYIARTLKELGHDARLMLAQYVKPYLRTQKNDFLDAEAICEAVGRPTMRFVPIKTREQQELQAVHRVRDRLVGRRNAVSNQIRGLLVEHGVTMRQGRGGLRGVVGSASCSRHVGLFVVVYRWLLIWSRLFIGSRMTVLGRWCWCCVCDRSRGRFFGAFGGCCAAQRAGEP